MNNSFVQCLASLSRCPMVVAHRGDSSHAPENTLEAARQAWECGADAWELDVQLTRDGVPVVLHDEFLDRTTDVADRFAGDPRDLGGYRLSDFDLAEVAELDAGSWFVHPSGERRSAIDFGTLDRLPRERRKLFESGTIRIPTLAQALALTVELDWMVNVEIKSFPESPAGLVEAVLDAIHQTGAANRVLVSSFDHRDVARLGSLAAQGSGPGASIARGILVETPLCRPADYVRDIVDAQTYHASSASLGAESITYRRGPSARALQGEDLKHLKEAGIPVLVFTVNDCREDGLACHLAELGVSGLFTDDPGGMVARIKPRGLLPHA